ncbi:MAG: hypothetical protein FE78DRAFT_138405, partial [Acidomyces sp. 'richmondensis']
DGGPENRLWTEILTEIYSIRNVRISTYYLQANGIVERRHRPVIDALAKIEGHTRQP